MQSTGTVMAQPMAVVSPSPAEAHATWLDQKKALNASKLLSLTTTELIQNSLKEVRRPIPGERGMDGQILIAIVDDEPVIAVTLAEILSKHGLETVWFTSPVSALSFFRVCEIALLLSDVTMPLMDGLALAVNTLELRPECAILLLSGRSYEPEQCRRVTSLGLAIHVEQKPVHVDQLLRVIDMLLARRRMDAPRALSAAPGGND